ncbi:hypothetical protein BN59_01875 [Legionella massiliensis]|uniref:Uncharacterized protein n=1 Tax=Legionella massiliensis TaxID=1034943 RepID=A0A078KX89_9GAMM|nr:hypothetical protein [Legionella massiliensis]CDZ77591.1 hypothetical protein BN59_01875 [Legionella massiliensis]CEE13329.1 hypothetical protein BN1094_01875 [Legionella massiliensis]
MLTIPHIMEIIQECREIGGDGLSNGVTAYIPDLEVDVLEPPCDFLGAQENPAIFVNDKTFHLLSWQHENWKENGTIALKYSFLKSSAIDIIGAIVHETGHAFNVAAKINNTEGNAYIFEIEVMLKLHETGNLKLFNCSDKDLKDFFKSRLSYYSKSTAGNPWLTQLVGTLKEQFDIEEPPKFNEKKTRHFPAERYSFFDRHWSKEQEIIERKISGMSRSQ